MATLKKLACTFIVGGVLGVIGQALFTFYIGVLGLDSPLLGAFLLVSMGLIGGILFIFGFYQKLEETAGFGAILPFSGFATGISGAIVGARMSGASLGQSIKAGLMVVVVIIGTGTVLSIIVGLITSWVG